MKIIKKENFYKYFESNNTISSYYTKITNKISNINLNTHSRKSARNKTVSISLFPSYLNPVFVENEFISIIKAPQRKIKGFAIVISDFTNITIFLQDEYRSKFRRDFLRLLTKFEHCFSPVYKIFFGKISRNDYDFLMDNLKSMLRNRFSQRGDTNHVLQNWDNYKNEIFSLINSKKASLFVIYLNEKPVQITINYHHNNILFVSILSYDINYSKFSLGNISIFKLIEWSIINKYTMLDLEYGDLDYKKRWSNYIYTFEHHIIYKNNNKLATVAAYIESHIILIKNFLKSKNIDTYLKRLKSVNKQKTTLNRIPKFELSLLSEESLNNLTTVNIKEEENSWLLQIIFNFIYANNEKIDDINILKNQTNTEFFIIGKHKKQKILLVKEYPNK